MPWLNFLIRFSVPSPWLGMRFWSGWGLRWWVSFRSVWSFPFQLTLFLILASYCHRSCHRLSDPARVCVLNHSARTYIKGKVLVAVDDLLGLFRSGCDVTFVVGVEVNDWLFFRLFDFESFGIKALFFELVFVDIISFFGRSLPHPTDHFHGWLYLNEEICIKGLNFY